MADLESEFNLLKLDHDVITQKSTDPNDKYLPESYFRNSAAEKKALTYADNFRRQYMYLYQDRKLLFIDPPNEYNIPKLVCTSLRPTQLKFKELYDYNKCAEFLADFLTYKMLPNPTELPTNLNSLTRCLNDQEGHCFEYSSLLCSLLLGAGYDAYVVSGYASIEVAEMNLSDKECPLLISDTQEGDSSKIETEIGTYEVRPPRSLKSNFEASIKAKHEMDEKNKLQQEMEESADTPTDSLYGLRVHSWVLVLAGNREVPLSFFLEATTGNLASIFDKSYLGIESIWNHRNYWVNMQSCAEGCKNLVFDLSDTRKWEYLLPNVPSRLVVQPDEQPPNIVSHSLHVQDKTFELPPSWVAPLVVSDVAYETRCPYGKKSVLYSKCKLEKFAPYLNENGMVGKLEIFSDNSLTTKLEIREWFLNRIDRILKRKICVTDNRIIEEFGKGRELNLKEHQYLKSEPDLEGSRTLNYYEKARVDGLQKRVITKSKMIEYFKLRDDLLIKQEAEFGKPRLVLQAADEKPKPMAGRRNVQKIVQYYERNHDKPASNDIAMCVFNIDEKKIFIKYHLEEDQITAMTREFQKPESIDDSMVTRFNPDMVTTFKVNTEVPDMKNYQLYQLLEDLFKKEENSINEVFRSENEVCDTLAKREAEETDCVLDISVYDTLRNEKARVHREEMERLNKEKERLRKEKEMDYLAPYLAQVGDPPTLTPEDAHKVYNSCLTDFKSRLVNMAKYIEAKFEKESQSLETKQNWYHQNQSSLKVQDEEEYSAYCTEVLFKISILEQKLIRHKELALKKFDMLRTKLDNDSRLRHLL